jgi:hypothetical protein
MELQGLQALAVMVKGTCSYSLIECVDHPNFLHMRLRSIVLLIPPSISSLLLDNWLVFLRIRISGVCRSF